MAFAIIGALAFLVLIGSLTMVWGIRRFQLSPVTQAIAFALTAASWVAFLVAAISITAIRLALISI
jgi:hypothetical protein